ncbi:MAG: hypothetical protein ACI4OH_01090 [Mitsuokella sp.]|uniref:hypothetical protein n=1 Tax=Mitsuokella sp. TaxID=2049034 RepID=UPI003F090270
MRKKPEKHTKAVPKELYDKMFEKMQDVFVTDEEYERMTPEQKRKCVEEAMEKFSRIMDEASAQMSDDDYDDYDEDDVLDHYPYGDINFDEEDSDVFYDDESSLVDAGGNMYYRDPTPFRETLDGYTKSELITIAEARGIHIRKSLHKAEYRMQLVLEMLNPDRMRNILLWLPHEEMQALLQLLEEKPPADMMDMFPEPAQLETVPYFGLPNLLEMGYLSELFVHDYVMPQDVADIMQNLLTVDFWVEYRQTAWIESAVSLAEDIYDVYPLSVLMQMLRQRPDFSWTEQEVLEHLAKVPTEMQTVFYQDGWLRPDLEEEPEENPPLSKDAVYYIPTQSEIWSHEFLDKSSERVWKAMFQLLGNKWPYLQETSFYEVLPDIMTMAFAQNMAEPKSKDILFAILQAVPELETAERHALVRDMLPFLKKIHDHARLPSQHGFSKIELKEQKKQEKAAERQARRAERAQRKVISLAERRKGKK